MPKGPKPKQQNRGPQTQGAKKAQKAKNAAPKPIKLGKRKVKPLKKKNAGSETSPTISGKVDQILSPSFSNQQVRNITVQSDFLTGQLRWAFIGIASYLAQKGMVSNAISTGVVLPWAAIYDGLSYLLTSINLLIQGGTVAVSELPQFALDYIAALKPKGIPYHYYSKVQYSWNTFTAQQSIGVQSVGNQEWNTTWVGDQDIGIYNEPANVWLSPAGGDPEQYAPLLKLLGNINGCWPLKVVSSEKVSILEKDASAFSRVYRYNGLTLFGPSAGGGYYKDAENEVNITSPMFCNFVDYIQPDLRVPAKLIACSGDAQSNMGRLFDVNFPGYYNKVPTVYKQIDFEEIYTFCVLWMAKMKESIQVNSAQPAANNKYAQPLPFSMQDFRLMLRQALLNVFDTQAFVQAIGLTQYGTTTNAFMPFMVMGHCYGAVDFNQMLVPQLIAENLNALKTRTLRITDKTSKQSMPVFVPVLGRFYEDDPTVPQYSLDGVMTPLFTNPVTPQHVISIGDCFDTSDSMYVNVNNGFYQGVLQDWNDNVQGLSGVSVKTCPIVKDKGPIGMGVLYFTRIQDISYTESRRKKGLAVAISQYQVQSLKYLMNPPDDFKRKSVAEMELVELKKKLKTLEPSATVVQKPEAIPPASVTTLSVVVETCIRPLLAEEEAFFGAIITPVARLSDTEDAVNTNMYQIETTEALTAFYTNRASAGVGMFAKLAALAGICVTGLGKDMTNTYTDIMSRLEQHSNAGILSSLLGGIVKSVIPGSDGIVDTVAGLLPF